MNCKPGDLAIVVRSRVGNEGRIVRCIRLATNAELDARQILGLNDPFWLIDGTVKAKDPFSQRIEEVDVCPDEILKPLRGEDESTDTALLQVEPEGVLA